LLRISPKFFEDELFGMARLGAKIDQTKMLVAAPGEALRLSLAGPVLALESNGLGSCSLERIAKWTTHCAINRRSKDHSCVPAAPENLMLRGFFVSSSLCNWSKI